MTKQSIQICHYRLPRRYAPRNDSLINQMKTETRNNPDFLPELGILLCFLFFQLLFQRAFLRAFLAYPGFPVPDITVKKETVKH